MQKKKKVQEEVVSTPVLETYHIPVLVNQVLETLVTKPDGLYMDVTFGGGGHSQAILETFPHSSVAGLDWDKDAHDNAQELLEHYPDRLQIFFGSFAHIYKVIKKYKIEGIQGILADFGTSQHQIHCKEGFSFAHDTPLDMRMSNSHFRVTAATIIASATPEELRHILWTYGEEQHAKKIVNAIVEERKKYRIKTTKHLAELIERVIPRRGSNTHPATKTFQALRIVVNRELQNIESFLPAALQALPSGGRLACISFHSLEDRLVKTFFNQKAQEGVAKIITKKALIADEKERSANPSSRSAKLRVIEKL